MWQWRVRRQGGLQHLPTRLRQGRWQAMPAGWHAVCRLALVRTSIMYMRVSIDIANTMWCSATCVS